MSRSDRRGLLLQSAHTFPSVAKRRHLPLAGEIKEQWPVSLTLMQLNTIVHDEEAHSPSNIISCHTTAQGIDRLC